MSAWSDGYVSEIGYTYGYYGELNPNHVVLPLLMAGLAVPEVATACELGFGQGVSLNAHMAASNVEWWGTDFNPSQAGFAQDLAKQSGGKAHIFDQSFGEFCTREDLPDFDFIGLHGIWSWISNENRKILVDFIRRKLKVGGVLYISYNTLPGWAATGPIRHILTEHSQKMGVGGTEINQRIKDSIKFTKDLLDLSYGYKSQVSVAQAKIANIENHNVNYVAHEYFNRDWQPMYFAEMQEWLEPAKVNYACAANYLDDFSSVLYDEKQETLLSSIKNPSFYQTVKDYLLNTQFRRDIWIKGPRKINGLQLQENWHSLSFLLVKPVEEVKLEIRPGKKTTLKEELVKPIINLLSDHKIHSIAYILEKLKGTINDQAVYEVLSILHGKGDVVLAQNAENLQDAELRTQKLNQYILQNAKSSFDIKYLASSVYGGAISYDYIHMLFLLAYSEGLKKPQQWVDYVWNLLKAKSEVLLRDGEKLMEEEENIKELEKRAKAFFDRYLKISIALKVVAE